MTVDDGFDDLRVETIRTSVGPVPVRRRDGDGNVVVCVHPALFDGRFWQPMVAELPPDVPVLVPDLPLGAQRRPVPADVSPTLEAVAAALVEIASASTSAPLVLVGNGTGGAIAQIAAGAHPDRVRGLVLAPCEVFEHLPPRGSRLLQSLCRYPAGARLVARLMTFGPVLANPSPHNDLTRRGVPRELVADWLAPPIRDRRIARDLATTLASQRPELTLAAADAVRDADIAVGVLWTRRGGPFRAEDGARFAAHVGAGRLEWVDTAGALVAWDEPAAMAAMVQAVRADASRRPS